MKLEKFDLLKKYCSNLLEVYRSTERYVLSLPHQSLSYLKMILSKSMVAVTILAMVIMQEANMEPQGTPTLVIIFLIPCYVFREEDLSWLQICWCVYTWQREHGAVGRGHT